LSLFFHRYSELGYNLACILTFPCVQRQGIGRFLIEFSYALSKKEDKVGSPEKPLSDLGALGYRSYWAGVILRVLKKFNGFILSVVDITIATSILAEDVVSTLSMLGLLQKSSTPGDDGYLIYAPPDLIDELLKKYPDNKYTVNPDRLHWITPYPVDPKKDKWSMYTLKHSASNMEKQLSLTSTMSITSVATATVGSHSAQVGGDSIKSETNGVAMEVA
jgi:histone acetyltransferase MYST1